jgi:hypothetical protein
MPRYYNPKRGPLPLELNHAGSTIVPAKSFVEIAREDEGSASVVKYVRKGLLVPPKLRPTPKPVAVAPVVAAPTPAPKPDPVVEPEAEAQAEEQSSVKPKSTSRKKRARR